MAGPVVSKNLSRDERLQHGWQAEDEIISVLERMVGSFRRPKGGQISFADTQEKIDGYLTFPNGRELSVQIKTRQSGGDILVEVWKDFEKNVEGRDMKSKAAIYIVRDLSGRLIMVNTSQVKNAVYRLIEEWDRSGSQFDQRGWFKGSVGSMKLDRGDPPALHKVVAFLPSQQFSGGMIEGVPSRINVRAA